MLIIKKSEIILKDLVKVLLAGQVIVMPTETAYGLIADATNQKAVMKIYQIKNRKSQKPLPVICSSFYQVKKFFYLPKKIENLAKKYWPGALSVKLKIKDKKIKVNKLDDTAVVRISSDELLRNLARKLQKPITATSANISGTFVCYDAQDIIDQFKNKKYQPNILLDGGKIKKRKPSTIISLSDNKFKIIRQGEIKI